MSLPTTNHQPPTTFILGIETSCDETAASVVTSNREILSNVVFSQIAEHSPYGGVVPEIAARSHLQEILPVVKQAMDKAGCKPEDISAVAATGGPGLIGGVIVGVMTAKALASGWSKPFIAINHLEGHALTARLTHNTPYPYLLLLASGGHCQFVEVLGLGKYKKLGGTLDDALGECFDKVAKMLGLGFPGGPAVEKAARRGNPHRFPLPVPLKGREGCDFSFSGLKTAVWQQAEKLRAADTLDTHTVADLCASFQFTAMQAVVERTRHAMEIYSGEKKLVVAGGVAANATLRHELETLCAEKNYTLTCPPPALCTDNAAMIAWAGCEHFLAGETSPLDFEPRARWPLGE